MAPASKYAWPVLAGSVLLLSAATFAQTSSPTTVSTPEQVARGKSRASPNERVSPVCLNEFYSKAHSTSADLAAGVTRRDARTISAIEKPVGYGEFRLPSGRQLKVVVTHPTRSAEEAGVLRAPGTKLVNFVRAAHKAPVPKRRDLPVAPREIYGGYDSTMRSAIPDLEGKQNDQATINRASVVFVSCNTSSS